MNEEKPTLTMYCKYCGEKTEQSFEGEEMKKGFTITFYCPKCGSYHTFEFFGSKYSQTTELE